MQRRPGTGRALRQGDGNAGGTLDGGGGIDGCIYPLAQTDHRKYFSRPDNVRRRQRNVGIFLRFHGLQRLEPGDPAVHFSATDIDRPHEYCLPA